MTQTQTESPSRFALLNSSGPKLADQYADTLAIGWRHRANRIDSPAFTFADLYESDDRLQAALDALVFLGRHGESHMRDMLQYPVRKGELFTISVYALSVANQPLLDACLDLAVAMPDLQDALADACLWVSDTKTLAGVIERLPAKVRMQVAGSRFRDIPGLADTTVAWLRTLEPAQDNIVALCRLLRQMGRSDLAPALGRYFVHDNPEVRAAAASAAISLAGEKSTQSASTTLADLIESPNVIAREIAVKYTIRFEPKLVPDVLARLAQISDVVRLYIRALGWAGKIDAIPTLLAYCEDDRYRRLAGSSLAMITGSDPIRDNWRGTPPETPRDTEKGDAMPVSNPDNGLPWPDAHAFGQWWKTNQERFDPRQHYFGGRPITRDWLIQIVKGGPLAWRRIAADQLQHATAAPLFPTHLRAAAQCALFTGLA